MCSSWGVGYVRYIDTEHAIASRRSPLSPHIGRLVRGSTPRDRGALTNLTPVDAARIRDTDKVAARYLMRYITQASLLYGTERWCLRLGEGDHAAVGRSPELTKRVARVAQSRGATAEVPPWVFAEDRQPGGPFIAVVRRLPRSASVVALCSFDQGEVVGDTVWVIGEKHLLTAAVVASRAYRLWLDTISTEHGLDVSVAQSAAHNTFPLPDLTPAWERGLEDAGERMLLARSHASAEVFEDLYNRAKMPKPLLQAHDDIDALMAEILGVAVTCSDVQLRRALLRSHRAMTETPPPPKHRAA
jgi:hypothetical protein